MKRRELIKKSAISAAVAATVTSKSSADSAGTEKAPSAVSQNRDSGEKRSFDYIIVGGGTAGPALAARLSEDPKVTVLLIEAGKENTKEAMSYVNGAGQMWAPDTNWGYKSTPQSKLKDRQIMLPRGKVVGGSASINIGSWSRGCEGNYNSWGLEGWDWETVMAWYRKIENNKEGENEYRGGSGPMMLERTPKGTEMTELFRKASIEVGVGATADLNGEVTEGCSLWDCIFRNGRRHNTVHNYLDQARTRSNLTIQTETFVSKVIIHNHEAKAVETMREGAVEIITATREIILSAGTYATPKVLMLSGVGPADYLKKLGIPLVHDLPGVGQNLSDHLRTDLGILSPDGVGTSLRANPKDPDELEEWRRTGYGPLAVAENTSAAFCKSSDAEPVADIELMFNINAPVKWGSPPPKNNGYYINIGLVQPKSKGSIKLASADPKESLLVDPNYLSDERDLKRYIDGMKIALKFPSSKTLKPYSDLDTLTIGLDASDKDLEDYIRSRAESIYHPVGTAKMGKKEDANAVVNEQLQVHGIKNLRVADASVIPELITGHTMAPTVLIAERAADFIKKG